MMDSCSRLEASSSWPVDSPDFRGGRIVERDLQQGSLSGEGGTQLVGGIGDEMSLRREGCLKALEETVEGVTQLFELLVSSFQCEPFVQIGGRDPAGGGGDGAHRAQGPAGHDPTEYDSHHGHDHQCDARFDQLVTEVATALIGRHCSLELMQMADC